MVVQRSPPPVRRSPRKEAALSQASYSSLSSQTSHAKQTGKLSSFAPSATSQAEPATPVQLPPTSDFPSLDQMAAVSKEQRSASRPANRAAITASFTATSSNHVPSSLPRPTAHLHRIQLDDDDNQNHRSRPGRSSLTNGAIQRVRQQAGDETPLGVSQARAARQAATATATASSKHNSSLLADDSGDSTAQLIPGRRDVAVNPVHATIDVENPQMPGLARATGPVPASQPVQNNTTTAALPAVADGAADASTSSQASIFGTANRRNGRDVPIGAASAGTAYDFDKYLDGELDPFNRASRANPRRESRPLPVQQSAHDDQDAETSGDTTARGGLAPLSHTAPTTAPIESTPLISRVKAISTNTPRMSPHASPSVSSRKLAHLSSLSNGNAVPTNGNATQSGSGDASTASLTSHHRYDPSARTDRLQTMELGELRKKHAILVRDLALAQDAVNSAKEESEGWASECTGLQEQLAMLKTTHQTAIAREARARAELQVRLSQYKIEADDRAWKLLTQRRQTCLVDVALQHAKNEATYHEGRYHATQSELEGQKDELRIRLMLERKRADLLAAHLKAALRDGVRLKKRLSAKSAALVELQNENERLAEQLEDAQHSQQSTAANQGEIAALRQQLEEAQAEIETLNERDAMMAETRKTWKAERKQLLAQVEQLSSTSASASASAPAPSSKLQKLSEASRAFKTSKPLAVSEMLPPSSPVYAKKKSRQPMQGASELGPLSEDEQDLRVVGATTARKANTAKITSPLVPFAQISSKAALAKKATKPVKQITSSKSKSSKNWRDEVGITDSSEEESDDERDRRHRGRRPADVSDSEQDSGKSGRAKTKSIKQKSSAKRATTNASSTTRTSTKSSQARKLKAAMPIEYDDQTADPSATPIIRSNKRNIHDDESDDHGGPAADSSVLGAKFGRDRTNLGVSTLKSKMSKAGKTVASATEAEGQVKKKKRKLLGGVGGAMQWGVGAGGMGSDAANDAAGLAPNFDIPLELSPIKGGSTAAARGNGAPLLAGFALPSRNPFA